MPNPYASTAGASTITATVSGNDNLNDFRDSRGGGNSDCAQKPIGTAQVARRIFAYVRPHILLFVASFVCSALSVVLQLFVPILIGRAIDLIVSAGRVDMAALVPLLARLCGNRSRRSCVAVGAGCVRESALLHHRVRSAHRGV